jgi:hypothetical protein
MIQGKTEVLRETPVLSLCHFDKFHMDFHGTEPIPSWLSPLNLFENKLNFKYDEDD